MQRQRGGTEGAGLQVCVRVCVCVCVRANVPRMLVRMSQGRTESKLKRPFCLHTSCMLLSVGMLAGSHAGEHVSAVGTHCRSPQLWTTCCVHVAPGAPPTPQVVPSSTVADARCDACTGAQERLDTNVLVDGQSTSSQAHKTLPCAGVDSRGRPHS
eukprot:scaffold20212_cov25-Tisochrysis_lutea.AAC.2